MGKKWVGPRKMFDRFFDKLNQEIYRHTLPRIYHHVDYLIFWLYWQYLNLCTLWAHNLTLIEGSVRSVRSEAKHFELENISSTCYIIVYCLVAKIHFSDLVSDCCYAEFMLIPQKVHNFSFPKWYITLCHIVQNCSSDKPS